MESDNLRTRIAAVQLDHYPTECAGYLRCGCGANFVPWSGAKAAWGNHLADAVIAELGLKHYCRNCGGWGPFDE